QRQIASRPSLAPQSVFPGIKCTRAESAPPPNLRALAETSAPALPLASHHLRPRVTSPVPVRRGVPVSPAPTAAPSPPPARTSTPWLTGPLAVLSSLNVALARSL